MELNHWNSILEKVKPHIPTINFNSSSSEDEGIVTIFQRPAGLSLKVPEDTQEDSFPMEDAELEELLKPFTQTCWSEENCSQSVKLDDEIVESTTATHWGTQHSGTAAEASACEKNLVELNRVKLDAKSNVDNTKSDKGFPVLSFAMLDQWDLDDVLQNLKDELPLQQGVSGEVAKIHADGDKDRSQNIMEKLVAFCKSQSVSDLAKSPNHIRQNNVCNKSFENMATELQLSHQECPTVYIDLRCPDPSIKPPRTSPKLSSDYKSPAKHNTHQEIPPAKKPNLKVHIGSRAGDREVTGKSMLLQKIREMNGNGNKYPKEPKQQRDQRQRQQVKQTLQHEHQQILKELKIHRPTKSVREKQPAAEKTDVLYDFEASHLQSISTLPADIASKGCMLLTVSLSSPGMVEGRSYGKRKYLDPVTKANIYNTLVAWFLSLVGPDPHHDEDEVGAKVPFWVTGLQQLWTEDGLALHVLAVARYSYTPRKRDTDIHAPFHKHVCRFLSETPLALIAHWLPPTSPIHLPSSYLSCFISATSNKKVIDRTFGLSPGFYWQTVETQECVCKGRETAQELHTEVSFTLWCAFSLHPIITHRTLQLVLDSGLDVCGLRLLYPPQGVLSNCIGAEPVIQRADETCWPVLALAVRGPRAHSVMKDLTNSLDPMLLKKTEPTSKNHCRGQGSPLLYSPQLASQVHKELCLWFSGRLRGGRTQNHSQPNKVVPSGDRAGCNLFNVRSSALLCATTKGDMLLVVSPIVPPCCYVQVLAVCERRGFSLRGLQRLQLQSNGAAVLGLTNQQALVYCSPPIVPPDQEELELPSHSLVLILRKENALCHSVTLPAALMREFEAQQLLGCIRSRHNDDQAVEPSLCFHTVPYNSNLFHIFVRCMWAVPNPSDVILSRQKCPFKSDMEQVVILTLCGKDMSQGLSLLHRVLTERPQGDVRYSPFELLGLKWLPVLTRLQAQGLSPYEVGEQLYHGSLDRLMSSPALLCALRRPDAFASLQKLLPHDYPGDLSVLMSPTPEVAFRQASLFFFDHEMIPDPQMLLTVFLFKPSVWNHTLATILCKLQQSGLTLVGLRVVTLDKSDANSRLSAENDPSDLEARVQFLCSGSSLALCFKGENAVQRLLDMLGQEDSSLWTACYGSGTYQRAIQDVKRFFPGGLCSAETSIMRQEQIFSLCSDSLASVVREQSCTLAPAAKEGLSPLMAPGPNGVPGTLIHIALWQTTCLLLPLKVPSQLDMLEQLLRSGCHLVAGRLTILDNEQRQHIARILLSSGNEKMTHLHSAPCLIIALQGEKVVTRFDLILQSIYKERSDLQKVGETMIYPESEKEAEQLICYLFDALSPESWYTIVP
ncbi:dynein axonemal assembly factor 8 [Thunnus albacares]|uniref:dynein axonemal assembly factor 8 n=1 Tax=Thunnus albacares TaxID=8236 RepID=UPI001CF62BED|nr:dynein axonemal assembly factor 8 [Thunnus albacares]